MLSNDMLSTINSDFSQRSIVMQYVKNFLKKMYVFLSLIFSNCVKRHVEKDKLRFKPESICNAFCMCRFFCKDVYIFTPIFLNGVKRHIEYDKLRFQPEIIGNAVCGRFVLQKCVYFKPYFSKMVSCDMLVEYDKLRFLQEIICNAICDDVFLQK